MEAKRISPAGNGARNGDTPNNTNPATGALELAENGIPVFLVGDDKQPLVAGGFKAATTDADTVAGWWQRFPRALVAVPTGAASGLWALDIDPDGQEWAAEHGELLMAAGRIHHTRRGRHYLFRHSEGIGNNNGKIAKGVDVKGEGGYVVWWPATGMESHGSVEDVATAPDALLALVRTAESRTERPAQAPAASGGVIPDGQRDSTLASLAGAMRRKGLTADEIEPALAAINRNRCRPPLADSDLARIAQSVSRYAAGEAMPAEPAADEWPTAVDIFGNLAVPRFPVEIVPDPVGAYAEDQAALIGADAGMIALAALATVAGCTDDRIEIQPKRHDPTWTESARLWVAPIGPPSAKKSPALKKATAPAWKVDAQWRDESNRPLADWEKTCKRMAKEQPEETPPPKPTLKRLMCGDVTVEKAGAVLAECEPRGSIVFRDELTGWLSAMDAYKQGGGKDRADWLEAYNGGPNVIDRVSRGSLYIENWSATVIGGIQPDVIEKYAGATNHDGMIQRFILLFADDGGRGADRPPDEQAREGYKRLIEHAARLTPGAGPVKLSEGAHAARESLWDRIHRFSQASPNPFLSAALGKWEGLSARLMLTFHVIECTREGVHPSERPVSEHTAQSVADLMLFTLLPHAIRFYAGMDDTEDKARQVASLLLAKGWERLTVRRDLDRYMAATRKWKPWETDDAMRRLESFGWLAAIPGKLTERGTPAAYAVNPHVHERFAAVAAMMREIRPT